MPHKDRHAVKVRRDAQRYGSQRAPWIVGRKITSPCQTPVATEMKRSSRFVRVPASSSTPSEDGNERPHRTARAICTWRTRWQTNMALLKLTSTASRLRHLNSRWEPTLHSMALSALSVTNLDWNEGCVFIQLTDEADPQPLEMGALIENDLSSGENHTYIVGTLYLLPPSRVEFASPGCEGEGPTQIDVLPTGDGPWSVTLTDAQENSFEGTLDNEGVGVMFGDLTWPQAPTPTPSTTRAAWAVAPWRARTL